MMYHLIQNMSSCLFIVTANVVFTLENNKLKNKFRKLNKNLTK